MASNPLPLLSLCRDNPSPPIPQVLLNYRRWRVDQYQAILPSLTPERLDAFVGGRLFSRLFLEALVVGNIPAEQAGTIVQHAQRKMQEAWNTSDVWQG